MNSFLHPIQKQLADISVTRVDEALVSEFQSEGDFIGVALDLLIEAGSYSLVAANIFQNEDMSWTRDQAILGGHLIRLHKLVDSLLDQTCKHRREISVVLSRLIFECTVNLRYMLANLSDDLLRSYRIYSLQHELKLLELVEATIAERGDQPQPIEERMIKSILASFAASDLTRQGVAENRQRNWGGQNFYERAKSLGLEHAYLAAFAGGSHSIHGNWQDLLEYHLEKVDDNTYRPSIHWRAPRPQILEALVSHIVPTVADYLEYITGSIDLYFQERLDDLLERTHQLNSFHEAFLVKSSGDA